MTYNTGNEHYTKVCGRVIAYTQSTVQAFRGGQRDIHDYYLDGVSITHGSSRQHIWSFVGGTYALGCAAFKCPCAGGIPGIPSYVGNNYF